MPNQFLWCLWFIYHTHVDAQYTLTRRHPPNTQSQDAKLLHEAWIRSPYRAALLDAASAAGEDITKPDPSWDKPETVIFYQPKVCRCCRAAVCAGIAAANAPRGLPIVQSEGALCLWGIFTSCPAFLFLLSRCICAGGLVRPRHAEHLPSSAARYLRCRCIYTNPLLFSLNCDNWRPFIK